MKMYDKKSLSLIDGMLVSEFGDIVMPSASVVKQANKLETMCQQNDYIQKQPAAAPMPTLDGFKRASIDDIDAFKFDVCTPILDLEAQRSMFIMDELDDMRAVDTANNLMEDFVDLLKFVESDYVVDCGCTIEKFDTPTIGSVLLLTPERISEIIASICGIMPNDIEPDECECQSAEDNKA